MNGWRIVGHEWAVAALKRALATDHVPHALLFVGPPGVGKYTLAHTFACALQCVAADVTARPCGSCRPCLQIEAGTYPDVRVIETERVGSGQRQDRRDISIDQIRALQHQVSLKPYEGRWVVGIIADAHEMSEAAANCLLKTLEEPQAHVVLILTAPDVGQLLPTIVSRCQVFSLRRLTIAQTEEALMTRFGVKPDQAALLARLSGGRIGWAVRAANDEKMILSLRRQRLDTLYHLLASGRRQRLEVAATMSDDYVRGVDGREALHETLDLWATWWRDLLLIQKGCAEQITNIDQVDHLHQAASHYMAEQAVTCLNALIATREHLERNVNPRLALEVLLLSLPQSE